MCMHQKNSISADGAGIDQQASCDMKGAVDVDPIHCTWHIELHSDLIFGYPSQAQRTILS